MTLVDVILLGVLEGLTEFLPVSSTGHLILLDRVLGHDTEAAKVLEVVIQLGAIVAVALYFRKRLVSTAKGLLQGTAESRRLVGALLAAFIPTAAFGLLVHKWVKANLFGPVPVAGALILGGIAMVAVERYRKAKGIEGKTGIEHVTVKHGFMIGLCQCLSLWPGSSRAMTTIVGGQLCGLSTKTAAEFSFLLALPTLGAATVYDFYKNGHLLLAMPSGMSLLLVGLVVSFVVALLVVAVFLRHVERLGMAPFGLYRIALGAIVFLVLV